MKNLISSIVIALLAASSASAELILCTKNIPNWNETGDGGFAYSGPGPAVLINRDAERVTWTGTGGYISLNAELTNNGEGLIITRLNGRPSAERILSEKKTGQVVELVLADSMGGRGLLRVNLNRAAATWEHETDSSRETFDYCTTSVLE